MKFRHAFLLSLAAAVAALAAAAAPADDKEPLFPQRLNVNPPPIASDKTVRYDYDIVYVRAPRKGDDAPSQWTEIAHPALMDPGGDLMLLHPDGSEELLVEGGDDGSVTDPSVSFDGQWVYYSHIRGLKGTSQNGQPPFGGADIYKIHVKTRKIVRLTHQVFTPNTGAADWSKDFRKPDEKKTWLNYGVLNMGPCPLPGGRLVFISNRNAFRPPKHPSPTLQLFVMDDDGGNVECIGHLNLGMALHPTSSWTAASCSARWSRRGCATRSCGACGASIPTARTGSPSSAPSTPARPPTPSTSRRSSPTAASSPRSTTTRTTAVSAPISSCRRPRRRRRRLPGLRPGRPRRPAQPAAALRPLLQRQGQILPPAVQPGRHRIVHALRQHGEGPADPSVLDKTNSPAVGKFTHPSGAPDNHLLTVWSPGPANHQYGLKLPPLDGGIYLIKDGKPIDEPGQMLLIKNDPKYNESGRAPSSPTNASTAIEEPKRLAPLANDGTLSKHLPEGTPFGLVGTSSLYKRESYPNGAVPKGGVTAGFAGGHDRTDGYHGLDPFNTSENGASLNWFNQGADAGLYSNDDIHAIRILVLEPTTDRNRGPKSGRLFLNHAKERLRILGEIPVRKFAGDKQPLDPDGNPDTSFLAKIPADTAFTFQTLDKDGMVLNMAQTWHQLRPGEIRNDCGGCHAHSQKPTPFDKTAAAKPNYEVFDLTQKTPLLTTKALDESGKKWDAKDETGLRFEKGVKNVEYFRDVKPILDRSCVACHTAKKGKPAGNLVLDDDALVHFGNEPEMPGTYYRLALDTEARYGYKPVIHNGQWRQTNASRYVRKFQSRRSLLIWKVFGRRCDGWTNDDFPTETTPGDGTRCNTTASRRRHAAKPRPGRPRLHRQRHAAAGRRGRDLRRPGRRQDQGAAADGRGPADAGALDRPGLPDRPGLRPGPSRATRLRLDVDDQRPTLTLTYPQAGANAALTRILVGMCDAYTGLDMGTFRVTADFALAERLRATTWRRSSSRCRRASGS